MSTDILWSVTTIAPGASLDDCDQQPRYTLESAMSQLVAAGGVMLHALLT